MDYQGHLVDSEQPYPRHPNLVNEPGCHQHPASVLLGNEDSTDARIGVERSAPRPPAEAGNVDLPSPIGRDTRCLNSHRSTPQASVSDQVADAA